MPPQCLEASEETRSEPTQAGRAAQLLKSDSEGIMLLRSVASILSVCILACQMSEMGSASENAGTIPDFYQGINY